MQLSRTVQLSPVAGVCHRRRTFCSRFGGKPAIGRCSQRGDWAYVRQVVAPPCACSAGGATPPYLHAQNDYSQIGGIYLQDRSNIQNRRSPFSLAGHVREGSKPLDFCLQEFLACCERGGKDCILNYYKCAEITGEPIRHTVCPSEEPTIDE